MSDTTEKGPGIDEGMSTCCFNALVIDLDGTLLSSSKKVTARSIEALESCAGVGAKIVLATARPPRAVREFVPPAILRLCWKVCYNGALVLAPSDELIFHRSLDEATCNQLYSCILKRNREAPVAFEIMDRWYGNRDFSPDEKVAFGIRADAASPDILPFAPGKLPEVSKLLAVDISHHEELRTDFGALCNIVVTDKGRLTQIMHKEAAKDRTVSRMFTEFDLSPDHVLVFGDDLNDLSIFATYPYCVAMGNAVDELKARAWKITDTNDNDGVAAMVFKLLGEGRIGPRAGSRTAAPSKESGHAR